MPQEPFPFTRSLQTEEDYPFTRSLREGRTFTESLWEEASRPPFSELLMQSIKEARFPVLGVYSIDLKRLDWGRNATWVARMLPGQEDLEDWDKQSTAQKIRTSTQFVSAAALAGGFMEAGMGVVEAMQQLKKVKGWRHEFGVKPPKWKVNKKTGLLEIGEIKKYPKVPAKVTYRVPKQLLSLDEMARDFEKGGMGAVSRSIKQKFAVVEVVKKDALRVAMENLAKTAFKARVPTASAGEKTAIDISNQLVAGLPNSFDSRIADTILEQSLKLIAAAIPQLETFNSVTLPKREIDVPVREVPKEEFAERPLTTAEVGVTPTAEEVGVPSHNIEGLPPTAKLYHGTVQRNLESFIDKEGNLRLYGGGLPRKEFFQRMGNVPRPDIEFTDDAKGAVMFAQEGSGYAGISKGYRTFVFEINPKYVEQDVYLDEGDMVWKAEEELIIPKEAYRVLDEVGNEITTFGKGMVAEEIIPPITDHQLQTIDSLKGEKKFSLRLMRQATMAFADKESVEALNEHEAAALIEGMKAVPLRATGRPYIPSHRGDLLPSHFFTAGRAAGVESWVVPAWRYMEFINAKDIYDEVEVPYIAYQQEVHDKYRFFDELKKSVKGVKGAEKRLFHYLNGTLPETITLSPQETTAAKELRTILDDYADRLKLPPERRRENYIYHLFEAATQRELREKYPFVDEQHKDVPLTDAMISALGLKVPKEIFTPTLLQRLGRKQGLVEDVWKSMRAVTSIDLRRIHLQPALEKVRPLIGKYPETSRSYINDWLSYAVLKQQPPLDKIVNASANRFTTFIEKATKGKISFGSNPMKTMGYTFARLAYGGTVAFNLAIVGKNLTQQMLIPPLLNNPIHYGQAIGDVFTVKGHYLLKQSRVLTERFPMEAFDPKDVAKWIQKGMTPYKLVDYINVATAFLAGVRDAQAMNLPPDEVIKYGDRIAKISQYSYRPIDMPRFMWQGGGLGRAAGTLQSWPINYFTNYLPELVYPLITGYDTGGNKVPIHARGRLLEHLAIASLFIYSMYKFARVDFRKTFGPGVMPTYLAPALSLSLAIGQKVHGEITNNYEEVKEANRKLSNTVPMFIPAGLQTKKTYDAYQRLTTGIETDAAGKWKRNVGVEEAILGVFTYPAKRSDFFDTQKKVWELDNRMYKMRQKRSLLEHRGANYSKIHRLEDEMVKLGRERSRFAEKLSKIKEGYPTEDDREWIESLLHTWNLWP